MAEDDPNTRYKVVVNHEEQYSIWPADRPDPPGWTETGRPGTKAECLTWIEQNWTDMRPLSLRRLVESGP
jgi:MbtH protein